MVADGLSATIPPSDRPAPGRATERRSSTDDAPGPIRETESLDANLEILKNKRRRIALQVLAAVDGNRLSLSDLATATGKFEYGKPSEEITRAEQKRVYIAFLQNHLPKLIDAEVVEYDEATGIVSLTEPGLRLADDLAVFSDGMARRSPRYALLASGLAGAGLGWIGCLLLAGWLAWLPGALLAIGGGYLLYRH